MAHMTTVGVFGARGYTGREALRLLTAHPQARVAFTTGSGDGHVSHEAGLHQEADAYLLCLPHGVSGSYAARLREARPDAVVIDLSGDLRLPDASTYAAWYGQEHPAPELLAGKAVYGLSELNRERLRGARLVANPGCYATAVLLPLLPLVRSGLIDPADVVVDAKSGASGAGRSLREDLLFCELAENFSAYAPGRSHRHVGEIECVIEAHTGRSVQLTFCPHLLPVTRGILAALYVKTDREPEALAATLADAYGEERYVSLSSGRPPRLSDVVGTNACRLSVHAGAPGRVVVFSALDNLVKGAAGQAVQNLNLALGWDEGAGLPTGHGQEVS